MRGETFKVVSLNDPALHTERMTVEQVHAYRDTRNFSIVEPFLDSDKAQIFHCTEIPNRSMDQYVMAIDIESVMLRRAFVCGVKRVENHAQLDGVNQHWSPSGKEMTEDEADARFVASDRLEIGSVIFRRSFLRPGTAATYPLPRMCREALGQRHVLHVEPSPNTAASSNEERSESTEPSQDVTGND